MYLPGHVTQDTLCHIWLVILLLWGLFLLKLLLLMTMFTLCHIWLIVLVLLLGMFLLKLLLLKLLLVKLLLLPLLLMMPLFLSMSGPR
jgi:hypothetical protein